MIGTWRQQQATEALQDQLVEWRSVTEAEAVASAIADTVEIATTVKITQDAIDELFSTASGGEFASNADLMAGAAAFLTALGFEVVE